MQALLLGTLYLPSATVFLDLILEHSITLNGAEHTVLMHFGQILSANVIQRHISVRITGMVLVSLTRDRELTSFTMLR